LQTLLESLNVPVNFLEAVPAQTCKKDSSLSEESSLKCNFSMTNINICKNMVRNVFTTEGFLEY